MAKQKLYRDHRGKVYRSFKEMCDAYNIDASTVRRRLSNYWSLDEALEMPVRGKSKEEVAQVANRFNSTQ